VLVLAQAHCSSLSPADRIGRMSDLRITIDPVACDAYGYCAEILPEVIGLDEWGYPIIRDGPLDNELVVLARRAARDCPKRALTLRDKRIKPRLGAKPTAT
jgi:ferredoxin